MISFNGKEYVTNGIEDFCCCCNLANKFGWPTDDCPNCDYKGCSDFYNTKTFWYVLSK